VRARRAAAMRPSSPVQDPTGHEESAQLPSRRCDPVDGWGGVAADRMAACEAAVDIRRGCDTIHVILSLKKAGPSVSKTGRARERWQEATLTWSESTSAALTH
jgi:hypothetical protein